uniref:NFACT protein C-terminal domain-containing protein n=1 Tax=Helianthus annuus TaxID=4232 RepID=A0A251UWA9_HELAN
MFLSSCDKRFQNNLNKGVLHIIKKKFLVIFYKVFEAERMAMEEDDIKEIGEDEKEKLNDVDYLTGVPLPNDILLNAVPVCTHYVVAQSYKYRVKIIHGIVKKGKSCKNGDEFVWLHAGSKPMRERVD